MKIGIYAGEIPPPVFINNLVNGLADKGHNIIIYGKASYKHYQFSNSDVRQRKFPSNKIGVLLHSTYFLFRMSINQSYSCISIVKKIWKNSKSWIHFFHRTCRVFPPFMDDLDVFHVQWAKALVYYPEFIEKLKCPLVLSLRGAHINYSPLADKNLEQGYLKYFPKVARFHAVSNAIAIVAEKYTAEPSRITVIYPAVKSKLMNNFANQATKKSEKTEIISVGRCHWKKGYSFALDTMAILKKEGVQFNYTIIAGGRDHENIYYQIHDLALDEFVTFVNGLPHEEVIERILGSDLFLLSSVEEGISNAVLEAMALGIPVISTDCGGMSEIIDDSYNGFIVPVREPEMMAKKILDFISMDDTKRKEITVNASQKISNNYILEDQIDKMIDVYRVTLQNPV